MSWSKLVDMKRTPEEKSDTYPTAMSAAMAQNDYPYGLKICLCEDELKKLNLSDDVESGDMIHLVAMGKVTNVNKSDDNGKKGVRVEITLTNMAVEDESHETDMPKPSFKEKADKRYADDEDETDEDEE